MTPLLLQVLYLLAQSGMLLDNRFVTEPNKFVSLVDYNKSLLMQGLVNGAECHPSGIVHAPAYSEHLTMSDSSPAILNVDVDTCAGRVRQVHVRPRIGLEDALVENRTGRRLLCV